MNRWLLMIYRLAMVATMVSKHEVIKVAALLVVAISLSLGLAYLGEPQSAWLWCDVLKIGVCYGE